MYKGFLKILFIGSIFLCAIIYFCCNRSFAESGEIGRNGFIIEENWDLGPPPAGFPACQGTSWHGWKPKEYDCQWGRESELSIHNSFTPPRSLHQVRSAGEHGTMDIAYILPSTQTRVHIRMYVYFGASFQNAHSYAGEEELIHFIFFNTAVAGGNFGVDIYNYTDYQPLQWPPVCETGSGLFFAFHSYYNTPNGQKKQDGYGPTEPRNCWNIKKHLEEWHCYEFMWDLRYHKVGMWVDGVQIVDRMMYTSNHSSINKIIISGWNSCGVCVSDMHDFYIDNIVMSDRYIGPLPSTIKRTSPASPNNLRIIAEE